MAMISFNTLLMEMLKCVQKFGLDCCDLPTMLSNVSTMLRKLALNIDTRNKERVSIVYVILTAICSIVYIYVYVLSAFWYTFWRALEVGDISGAFIMFSLNITSQVPIIKLFYMMFHEAKFKVLTKKYLALDARIPKGSRFSNNMLKNLRNVKIRGIIYWLILMMDGIIYIIKPLVTRGRHVSVETYIIYGLEPMLESPNYEIATISMNISVFFICYTAANITCFLILIIGYIEAQMLSLSEEITHLYDDAVYHFQKTTSSFKPIYYRNISKDVENEIINDYIKNHLVNIIGKHTTNVNYLREIEEVMRAPNAVGFLFLITGLIAELLGGLENTFLQLPYTMMQISMDCYLGQKIMDSNIQFEQAVYACKWEKFNESNRKIVLMMLQNSQKTMTLSSGGMVTLSFSCLMNVIKNTYSAYTTLRTTV